MSQTLILEKPKYFDFKRSVLSHGWCELLPFELARESWTLTTVIASQKPIEIQITDSQEGLQIKYDANILEGEKISSVIAHIFRFEENLQEFYQLAKAEKHLTWLAQQNAGRLLRSPTVYEDLVKTICTTNCSWALTKIMVGNLVNKLGQPAENGKKSFPAPKEMAEAPLDFYKTEIKAGYRAAYLKELAEKVAAGKLDLEKWLQADLPTSELKQEIKQIKGVGNYAAENLLKLLGRYEGLALDSWLRGKFYEKYNSGEVCSDRQIEAHYERFGKWRGLVIWCEMTEKWL